MLTKKESEMKIIFPIIMSLFVSASPVFSMNVEVLEEVQVPAYAKWGQIAMEKTKEKYPEATIIDYLHVGKKIGRTTSTETFKLWLKHNEKEFGVFVTIQFQNDSEHILDINFKEVTR